MNMKGIYHSNKVRRADCLIDYAAPEDRDADYMSNEAYLDAKISQDGAAPVSRLIYHKDMLGGGYEKRDLSPGQRSNAYTVEPAGTTLPKAVHQEGYEPSTTLRSQMSALRQSSGQTPTQPSLTQRHRKVVRAKKGPKAGGTFAAFGPLELKHLFDTYNTSNVKDFVGGAPSNANNPTGLQNPSKVETSNQATTVRQPAPLAGKRIVALAQKSSLPRLPTTFAAEGSGHGQSMPASGHHHR